jgi:hypothetical protein
VRLLLLEVEHSCLFGTVGSRRLIRINVSAFRDKNGRTALDAASGSQK